MRRRRRGAADRARSRPRSSPRGGLLRAIATGAVALERGAALRAPVDEAAQLRAAAIALGMAERELGVVARNDYYRVFSENGSGARRRRRRARLRGARRALAARCCAATPAALLDELRAAVEEHTVNLGVAALLPRVALVSGARIVDLSDARRAEDLLAGARAVLAEHAGDAVAVVFS